LGCLLAGGGNLEGVLVLRKQVQAGVRLIRNSNGITSSMELRFAIIIWACIK